MARPPRVALVVLNWNGWEDTSECLEAVRRLRYRPLATYVVDNGSTDGSRERIPRSFPEVTFLPLPANRGFGAGMNAGIRAATEDGHEFILCLNNDMVVDPDFLAPLVAATHQEGVVPYPALYRYAEPEVVDSVGHRVNLYTGITRPVPPGDPGLPESVQLLSRSQWEALGGWREEYFAMYEDTELDLRMTAAGLRPVCILDSKVYHKRGRTSGRVRGLVSYYSIRNRLLLVQTHGDGWQYVTTLLHVFLMTLPYLGLRGLLSRHYKHSFKHLLLGLLDGLIPSRRGIRRRWTMGHEREDA